MKRFFILISCILLIVSLSISALAARVPIDWKDYIDYTYPGIDYDINDVFIPYDKTGGSWVFYLGNKNISVPAGPTFSYTFDDASSVSTYNLQFLLQNDMMLDVSSLTQQSSLDVHFLLSGSAVGRVVYRTYVFYYDSSGNSLKNVESTWKELPSGDTYTIPIDLTSMPDGTKYLSFRFQFSGNNRSDYPIVSGDSISMTYLGISFEVLTPGTIVFEPRIIKPEDYLISESSDGTFTTLYVSVPAEDLTLQWQVLRDDDYSIIRQSYANPYQISLGPPANFQYWIDCLVFDELDVSDIVDGSTMTVHFKILPDLNGYTVEPSSVRYQVRYFDGLGNLLDTVNFFQIAGADSFTDTKAEIPISKPAGTSTMRFYLQFMDLEGNFPALINLELESINFACDIPTMVRVQQETGRTNQLLNELVNGDHGFDSSGSNFGSDADNLAGAGDQMDDAMGSGMDALGSMTNSQAFTGTVATLTALVGTVFEGHEITICGITANPFTLAATVLSVAVLLPLALKYVFRKRGSG